MGQVMNRFKRGGEDADKKQIPKGLADFLEKEDFKKFEDGEELKVFEDFYHQLYMVIEKLNEKGGAMQFKLPEKTVLEKKIRIHWKTGTLGKEEFKKIMEELIQLESFTIGSGAREGIAFLFGIPIVALFARRLIPGFQSISEDVVIPVATAGTAVILTKIGRL